MENFVVSARKYRPATFDSVIGQEHITQTLKNAMRNNHLAHAFLFCGPRGVGKTTCARILAKTINCQNITTDMEACNECDSCKAFNEHASFNIYELDAASNNSVDDISGLVEQVRYAPQGAKYKIYIIDEVHMLSAAAFNAFLKTLEEPPPYAKFILATTERHKILPTILSRCQVFDFHRIRIEHAVAQLKKICTSEGITAEEEALHVIAQKADGAMRDALSIFDRIVSFSGKNITYKDVILNLNILDYECYFKAVDLMLNKNLPDMLLLFNDVLTNGFDIQHFLNGFSEHIRNLLMCKYPNTVKLIEVAPAVAQKFMQQSAQSNVALLMNALNVLNKCELEFKASKNPRLHVELTLMKLTQLQSVLDAAGLKKKMTEHSVITQTPAEIPPVTQTQNPEITTTPEKSLVGVNEPTAQYTSTKPLPASFPKSGTAAQSKLDRLRQQVNEAKKTDVGEDTKPAPLTHNNTDPVTEIGFIEAWDLYLSQLDAQGKMSMSVIYKEAKWSVISPNEVQLILGSLHESEMFEGDRVNIIQFMRNRLNNFTFDFRIEVNKTQQTKKAFTAEDRFNAMADKNPLWHELRNTLGLELEY